MARALAAAIVVSLLAVSGAGGSDAQTPKRGGTVVVGQAFLSQEPACLNIFRNCGVAHIEEVLEGAFEIAPGNLRPNLVSDVDYTRTPPFRLTYHIRPEARWSDGVPITARDFVFTFRAFRRHQPDSPEAQAVRSVRVLDAKTVRVVLKSRSAGWRFLFDLVLPRHALVGENLLEVWRDRIDNPKTGQPIGSGPFLLERWGRGRQIVLRRNSRYWGSHLAYLDRVILRLGSLGSLRELDEAAVAALESGEIDVHHRRADPTTEPAFRNIGGVEHRYGPGQGWEHFAIRVGAGGHPALRNKLVRRALAYGLDRKAIVRGVFGQFVPGMRSSESAIFLASSKYHRSNWSGYRYRPALARSLLEQAGCIRGRDGIFSCAGERMRLRFVTIAGVPRRSRVLELAQPQLRAAGIELVATYAPGGSFFDQLLPSGDFDVALFLFFKLPDELFEITRAFRCGGASNFMGYCQRLVTSDLDQAERILDPDSQARVLNRADVRMARDVPVIPLWHEPAAATIRSTIRGFAPSFPSLAWNAENWWLDR